jgi:hypothetical protein
MQIVQAINGYLTVKFLSNNSDQHAIRKFQINVVFLALLNRMS